MSEAKGFMLFHDNLEMLEALPPRECGLLAIALLRYSKTGEKTALPPKAEIAFMFMARSIDAGQEKRKSISEARRKAIQARWDKDKQIQDDTNNTNVLFEIQSDTEQEQEQEHEHEVTKVTSLAQTADAVSAGGAEQTPAVITIPLNTGPEYPITQAQVDEWVKLYPAVDVMQELRNCRAWNISNPTKRKTRGGILRHVNSWLSRQQDNPKTAGRPPPSKPGPATTGYAPSFDIEAFERSTLEIPAFKPREKGAP